MHEVAPELPQILAAWITSGLALLSIHIHNKKGK